MRYINFTHLHVENFRSLRNFDLDFDRAGSLVIIRGPNGSGKSSIFNSIYTCLYNRQLNSRPATKAITHGEDNCFIQLDFEVDSVPYSLQRVIGKNSYVELFKDGVSLVKGRQVSKVIEEIIPPDIVKLSMLQNFSIRDLIANLVDVDKFVKKVRDKHHKYVTNLSELEKQVTNLESEIKMVEQVIEQLSHQKTRIKEEINRIESSLANVTKELQQANYTPELQEKLQKFKTDLEVKYSNLESELKNRLQEEYVLPKNQILSELRLIDSKLAQVINVLKYSQTSSLKPLEDKQVQLTVEINNIKRDIARYQQLIQQRKCFVCERDIDDIDKYKRIVEDLERQVESKQQQITCIEQQKQKLVDEHNAKIQHYTERANKRKQELNTKLNELEEIKRSIEQSKLDLEKTKESVKRELLDKYGLSEQDIAIDIQSIDKLLKTKLELESALETNKKSLAQLQNSIDNYQKKLVQLRDSKTLDKLNVQIKSLQRSIDILETWQDTRLLKRLLVKDVSNKLNNILESRYSYMMQVNVTLDEKDELVITALNRHGAEVDLNDVSNGESVIAKLQLYCALLDLVSGYVRTNALFLDEFLDSLDEANVAKALIFLRELAHNKNMCIFVITHRTTQESSDYVVDLS